MAIKDDTRTESEKEQFAFWGQIHFDAAMVQLAVDQMAQAVARLEVQPDYLANASAKQITKVGKIKTWIANFLLPNAFRDKDAD